MPESSNTAVITRDELTEFFQEPLRQFGDMDRDRLSDILCPGFVFEYWRGKSAEAMAKSKSVRDWLEKLTMAIQQDAGEYDFVTDYNKGLLYKKIMKMWSEEVHNDAPAVWKQLHSRLHSEVVNNSFRDAVQAVMEGTSTNAFSGLDRDIKHTLGSGTESLAALQIA
ncbi:hypothetical protein Q5752_005308 [Cryptotrichosporon argae]